MYKEYRAFEYKKQFQTDDFPIENRASLSFLRRNDDLLGERLRDYQYATSWVINKKTKKFDFNTVYFNRRGDLIFLIIHE